MSDASLLIRLGVNTEALVAGIAKANSIMGSFQTTVKNLGSQLAAGVGFVGLGYAITNTVKSMAEFEHTMSAVKAITGATGDELNTLRSNALKMAAAFSSTEIAQFELEMARMGFTTNQVIDMTQAVVNLATATGENLAKSGEVAGATMNAFGLQAKDMTYITDVMSGALNLSSMKLDDLTQGLKYVAPVARQAGVSLEETAAMLVILANTGIKGSMASTSLRRILTDFTNDGVNASEKIAKLAKTGISLSDSFDEVGRTAQSTLAVLGNSGDAIQKMTVQLANMNGVTAEQAKIMQQDLVGAWNNLGAAWDRATKSGSFLTSMLAGLGNATAQAMDRLTGNKSNEGFFTPGAPLPFLSGFWDFLGFGESIDDKMKKNASLAGKKSSGSPSGGDSVPDVLKSMPMTIDQIEAKMKELKGNIGESFDPSQIAGFNAEIEKLQDRLYHMTNDKASWYKSAKARASSGDGFLGQPTEIATGTPGEQSDPFTVLSDRVAKMAIKIKTPLSTAKGLLDGFHLSAQKIGLTLSSMGAQMSTGFAQAIAGTVPFSQAMAQMADSVVNSLEQLVLAEIIQKSVEGSIGNPILAIAGAVAGFTAIKALFASIRGGGGGGGGGGSSAGGIRANQALTLAPGEFRVSGRDLVYTYDKNKALNPYSVGLG